VAETSVKSQAGVCTGSSAFADDDNLVRGCGQLARWSERMAAQAIGLQTLYDVELD
jgi:hypothetical protein